MLDTFSLLNTVSLLQMNVQEEESLEDKVYAVALRLENGNYLLCQKHLELLVAAEHLNTESTGPHQDHKKNLSSTER